MQFALHGLEHDSVWADNSLRLRLMHYAQGLPIIATMGIFGPWNATFSHYDGHTDSTNWGTLVSTGTSKMQTWINQHSSQCVPTTLTSLPSDSSSPQPYDVILILDLFHTQGRLAAYLIPS